AAELHGSCAMGAGQFCTKPGISVVEKSDEAEAFVEELRRLAQAARPGVLLSPQAPKDIAATVAQLREAGAELLAGGAIAEEVPGFAFQPTLLRVSGEAFLANPEALQSEAFGHVHLVVGAGSLAQMLQVAEAMEGNLTGTLYSHGDGDDDAAYDTIAPVLRTRVVGGIVVAVAVAVEGAGEVAF